MQQQVNQMIMQITAGIFGAKHLAEQKAQKPLTPAEQAKRDKENEIEMQQLTNNYSFITNQDIGDTKAAERLAKEKGISTENMQEHLDWAFGKAAENVGRRYSERRNIRAAKELAQRIARTPKILFDESATPTPPKSGGDK